MAVKRRRKMSALQAKYFGKKRRARSGSSRRRRSGGRVVVLNTNPRRKRRGAATLSKRRRRTFRRNPRPRVMRRRFRRNPIAVSGFLNNTIVPAAVGAGGAIATDLVANQLAWYLPASLQTPLMRPVTNIGISLLLGWAVGKVAGSKLGNEAAAGGIVVALYNFANQQLAGFGAGYGYGAGFAYDPNGYGAGATMNRYMNGMGYLRRRPAPVGVSTLDVTTPRLLNGGPSNQTKFRMMRNGSAGGTMGYLSPARTLGRYVNNGRG